MMRNVYMNNEFDKQQAEISQATAECQAFFGSMLNKKDVNAFDSISQNQVEKMPKVVQAFFDSAIIPEEKRSYLEKAIQAGIKEYAYRNGGDMPSAQNITSALYAGLNTGHYYKNAFDSASDLSRHISETEKKFFDSAVANGNFDQTAIVPALTVVTIANVIASSSPLISLIPNINKSKRVPLAYVRLTTDRNHLAMKKGEFLDGSQVAMPYVEGRYAVAMQLESGSTYKAVSHSVYSDFDKKLMDTNSKKIPFLSANVSIRLNGIEIAHTRNEHENSTQKGIVSAKIKKAKVTIAGVEYSVVSANANMDERSVSVQFDKALPDTGVLLLAHLTIDYDAKDENNNFINYPAGVAQSVTWDSIQSAPDQFGVTLLRTLINQFVNEINLGLLATAMSMLQGKYFLEQTCRLYRDAKTIAQYNQDKIYQFDMSRGSIGNISAATNTTGELMAEIFKVVDIAKSDMIKKTAGATVSVNILVSDNVKHLLATLPPDKYVQTGASAKYHEIVRVGTLSNGMDVYHTPSEHGIITEGNNTAEIMMMGIANEPAKSLFVGTIVEAPVMERMQVDTREITMMAHLDMVADVNPNEYYAQQVALIELINLPTLSTNK